MSDTPKHPLDGGDIWHLGTPETRIVLIALDEMLERKQAALWLKVSVEWLARDATQTNPKIPVFKLSNKVCRYHPRTIITALARRARVSPADIAAGFATVEKGKL